MNMKRILSFMLCGSLLFTCVGFAGCGANTPKNTLDGKKLVVYGDSLTAFGTWPLTTAENCNMYLFNGATGGINTTEALERFDKYVLERDPDFVTLCFGQNDLLMEGVDQPQVTPAQFKENLKIMCEKVTAAGATPILMTCSYMAIGYWWSSQAQNRTHYANVGSPIEWLEQYCNAVRELAEEGGYGLVDIRKACDEYNTEEFLTKDGVHLAELGNQVYADLLTAYLQETYGNDPKAEKITTRFPCTSSPAEPATLDIVSYDPADWDTPVAGEMEFDTNDEGHLLISNTNGRWPDAQYTADTSVYVPLEGTKLVCDFYTSPGVNTSIILFYNGATPFATTVGQYEVINTHLGVKTEPVSNDISSNQEVQVTIDLKDVVPDTAVDDKGNVMISGVKVYAAGGMYVPVVIRKLAVSTQGAPNE